MAKLTTIVIALFTLSIHLLLVLGLLSPGLVHREMLFAIHILAKTTLRIFIEMDINGVSMNTFDCLTILTTLFLAHLATSLAIYDLRNVLVSTITRDVLLLLAFKGFYYD